MVCKVDENFFARLDESFLWKEDKSDKAKSDYILFADKDCTDKDYYAIPHACCSNVKPKTIIFTALSVKIH